MRPCEKRERTEPPVLEVGEHKRWDVPTSATLQGVERGDCDGFNPAAVGVVP